MELFQPNTVKLKGIDVGDNFTKLMRPSHLAAFHKIENNIRLNIFLTASPG